MKKLFAPCRTPQNSRKGTHIFWILCGLPILVLVAACKSEPAAEVDYSAPGAPASHGGTLVAALGGQADNLLPWLTGSQPNHKISSLLYESILSYDKDLNLKGALAESWKISADQKSITFKLRENLLWEDGTPLTTQDVLATFNAITAPTTRTPYAGDFKLVSKLEILDAHTFRATYAEVFAPALSSWVGFSVLPAHVIQNEPDFNQSSLINKPLASGAYTLKHRDVASLHVLKSNPHYYEGEPFIAEQRFRTIPDQDTQFLELKAQKIDFMGLSPAQFMRVESGQKKTENYEAYKYLGNLYTYLGFNLKHPVLSQKEVRKALSHATPREGLINGVLLGYGLPIAGPFKPGTWAYNEKLSPPEFNLETAAEILRQAGWRDFNHDGILEKEVDGKRQTLSFTIITNQGNDQRIKTAEILQYYWKKIGVDVKILVQEWSTFITQTINNRQFEAFILGWSLTPEPDPYDIWHSSKTAAQEFNIISFNNSRADWLMEQARKTFNQDERKKYLDEFQEILHDEQPYLFLYAPYTLTALHKRVKNVEPTPAGLTHNFTQWYIPEDQRLYPTITP